MEILKDFPQIPENRIPICHIGQEVLEDSKLSQWFPDNPILFFSRFQEFLQYQREHTFTFPILDLPFQEIPLNVLKEFHFPLFCIHAQPWSPDFPQIYNRFWYYFWDSKNPDYERLKEALKDSFKITRFNLSVLRAGQLAQKILEHTYDIFFLVSFPDEDSKPVQGQVNILSSKKKDLGGYSLHEFEKDPKLWFSLIHEEDKERIQAGAVKLLENPDRVITREYRMKRKDGKGYIWLEDKLIFCEDHILGITRDITQKKKLEKSLKKRDEFLQRLVEALPQGVLLLDEEGKRIYYNEKGLHYLEKLVGKLAPNQSLFKICGQPLDEICCLYQEGEPLVVEKEDQVFQISGICVSASPGQACSLPLGNCRFLLMIEDITLQVRKEEAIQIKEHLAALGQMSAGIAHDMGNIFQGILGYTELVHGHPQLPPDARENLDLVLRQIQRASRFIDQVLDFSRKSPSEWGPLCLVSLLKEVVKLFRQTLSNKIRLSFHTKLKEAWILGSPFQMEQVFANLLVNSRDAIQSEGEIRIFLDSIHVNENSPHPQLKPGEWIRVTVQDTGEGIPKEIQDKIFHPFFTTKGHKGTGLGLSQVYGIVENHGGVIHLESQTGKGTTFILYFSATAPRAITDMTSVSVEEESQSGLPPGSSLLLVEDQKEARETLRNMLEYLGYQVIEVSHGKEALEILAKKGNQFQAVITDISMPEMDGLGLARSILEKGMDLPVYVITGYPLSQSREELLKKGIRNWVYKPVSMEGLKKLLVN